MNKAKTGVTARLFCFTDKMEFTGKSITLTAGVGARDSYAGGNMDQHATRKWKAKREKILRRDGYRCQECAKYGRFTPAVEVHHIKHADTHPELFFSDENLVSLCRKCHNKMHPEKGGRRKY